MDAEDLGGALSHTLFTEDQIARRIAELAEEVESDYDGAPLLLVGVLRGAMMVMADFSRRLHLPVEIDWIAISSYGAGTASSGIVRIQQDLDTDVAGRHVLVVEDVLDSGLTVKWLLRNLRARRPASVSVLTLLRKPGAVENRVEVRYVGFDVGNEFVVGYGMDHSQRYRNLTSIGVLSKPT